MFESQFESLKLRNKGIFGIPIGAFSMFQFGGGGGCGAGGGPDSHEIEEARANPFDNAQYL